MNAAETMRAFDTHLRDNWTATPVHYAEDSGFERPDGSYVRVKVLPSSAVAGAIGGASDITEGLTALDVFTPRVIPQASGISAELADQLMNLFRQKRLGTIATHTPWSRPFEDDDDPYSGWKVLIPWKRTDNGG